MFWETEGNRKVQSPNKHGWVLFVPLVLISILKGLADESVGQPRVGSEGRDLKFLGNNHLL